MSQKVEVKIFELQPNAEPGRSGPEVNDLHQVLEGTMMVSKYLPSKIDRDFQTSIEELQEKLIGKDLWLAVVLSNHEQVWLSTQPLVIDRSSHVLNDIGDRAASIFRFEGNRKNISFINSGQRS